MSLDRVGEAENGRQHACNLLISIAWLDTIFSIRSLNYRQKKRFPKPKVRGSNPFGTASKNK